MEKAWLSQIWEKYHQGIITLIATSLIGGTATWFSNGFQAAKARWQVPEQVAVINAKLDRHLSNDSAIRSEIATLRMDFNAHLQEHSIIEATRQEWKTAIEKRLERLEWQSSPFDRRHTVTLRHPNGKETII